MYLILVIPNATLRTLDSETGTGVLINALELSAFVMKTGLVFCIILGIVFGITYRIASNSVAEIDED